MATRRRIASATCGFIPEVCNQLQPGVLNHLIGDKKAVAENSYDCDPHFAHAKIR
jgi:hypothetical protein